MARNKHVSSIENINNNNNGNRRLMITVRAATGIWWGVVKIVFTIQIEFGKRLNNFDQFSFLQLKQLRYVDVNIYDFIMFELAAAADPWGGDFDWEQGVFDWKRKHKQYQLMTIQMTLFSFSFVSFWRVRVFRWMIECFSFALRWWDLVDLWRPNEISRTFFAIESILTEKVDRIIKYNLYGRN